MKKILFILLSLLMITTTTFASLPPLSTYCVDSVSHINEENWSDFGIENTSDDEDCICFGDIPLMTEWRDIGCKKIGMEQKRYVTKQTGPECVSNTTVTEKRFDNRDYCTICGESVPLSEWEKTGCENENTATYEQMIWRETLDADLSKCIGGNFKDIEKRFESDCEIPAIQFIIPFSSDPIISLIIIIIVAIIIFNVYMRFKTHKSRGSYTGKKRGLK